MKLLNQSDFYEQLNEKSNSVHNYACLMLNALEVPYLPDLQARINPKDLYDPDGQHGIEDEPHITIKYGLMDWEFNSILIDKILRDAEPVLYNLGHISCFQNKEFDVLKIEVESPQLQKINYNISKLPNEDKFPVYTPHLTIAYLKPGRGQKYARSMPIHEMISNECIWSPTLNAQRKNDFKRTIYLKYLI